MNTLRLAWVISAGWLLFGGCGGKTEAAGGTGSETNWLVRCETDAECGSNLSCLCEICTRPCQNENQCGQGSQCVPSTARSSCDAEEVTALCVPSCATLNCDDGQLCTAGACVDAVDAAANMPVPTSTDGGSTARDASASGPLVPRLPQLFSSGCGKQAPEDGVYTLPTSGTKPADCFDLECGDWSSVREYAIAKPQNYDPNRLHSLVFLGAGESGTSTDILNQYSYDDNAGGTTIRIGLRPSEEIQAVHGSKAGFGYFDDHEGDDSVDFVFYEQLYDKLESELCFDRNLVFAGGQLTGGALANELGCKYAGDAQRPIRGVLATSGGLPEMEFWPTCSNAPLAGFWVHAVGDTLFPFANAVTTINRAIAANDCSTTTSVDTGVYVNYPVGGNEPDDECQRIVDCDPRYPIVICPLPYNTTGPFSNVVNPGGSRFLRGFVTQSE